MIKLTLISILFCAALGSVTAKKLNQNRYFVTANPSTWAVAQKDCKTREFTLLSIETDEEYDAIVAELLSDGGLGTEYWTSGLYNSAKKDYMWETGQYFTLNSRYWAPNEPPRTPNSLLRIAISYDSPFENNLVTKPSTSMHRYVCENLAEPMFI